MNDKELLNGFELLELSEKIIDTFEFGNIDEGRKLATEFLIGRGAKWTATGQIYFLDENGKAYIPCQSGASLYIDL